MVDPNKIRLMTKLAIYDKNYYEKDKRANEYFRHDYIYWHNFWTRLYVFLGILILVGFYALDLVFVKQSDIISLDFKAEAYKIAVFALGVMVFYTVIGSLIATKAYSLSQKRIKEQMALINRLDKFNLTNINLKATPEGENLFYYGTDTGDKGNNN